MGRGFREKDTILTNIVQEKRLYSRGPFLEELVVIFFHLEWNPDTV